MQDGAEPSGAYRYDSRPARPIFGSLIRGAALKCPACGAGAMFRRYLKVADACPQCGEELHHHRADDAPPYFTIVIVGHVVVSLLLAVEMAYRPPLWLHAAIWLPLTVLLALMLLPPIKGAIIPGLWFTQFFLLSFFLPFLADGSKKGKKIGMISVVAVMVSLIIVDLTVLFVLGESVHTKVYPLMVVAQYIRIGEFFENLESIVIAIWIVGTFIKISVFFYAISLGTAQWLNLSSYRSIVWPLGILIVIFSFWSLPSTMDIENLVAPVPLGFLVQLIIPLLLLIIALIRKRKK